MEHLLVAALIGATVLYLYDIYATGPAAMRVFIAHLPALGYAMLIGWKDWPELLSTYACVPVSLFVVALLQLVMVQRDVALSRAFSRR